MRSKSFLCCPSDADFSSRKVFQIDIARTSIDSAIDFDDTSEFQSLVPTCAMKKSGLSFIDGFL